MNAYKFIGIAILSILLISYLDLAPSIVKLFDSLAEIAERFANDIVPIKDKGSKPYIFDLALRMILLITFIALVKIFVFGRGKHDE